MRMFAHSKKIEDDILSGKIVNQEALRLLKKGSNINTRAIYLCRKCKEFANNDTMYMQDNITISPYGTARYDVVFPFGSPLCEVCGSKLEYIKNIRSSNVKCPKCGGDMKSRIAGYTD